MKEIDRRLLKWFSRRLDPDYIRYFKKERLEDLDKKYMQTLSVRLENTRRVEND